MSLRSVSIVALLVILAVPGCGSDAKSDAQFEAEIVRNLNQSMSDSAVAVHQAAISLHDATPVPAGRGWDDSDKAAVDAMKTAWVQMRMSWESSESVLAVLRPDLDTSLDTRYEDFLTSLGAAGDSDLFDGQGVTGMHAIERILYAPVTPSAVVAREALLPGYVAAAWPATPAQASELKSGLCQQLVDDSQKLVDGWTPSAINLDKAFGGLTGLMSEQAEKLKLAAQHLDESRYAQRTLGDLRQNLVGTRAIYDLFAPWVAAKPSGDLLNQQVEMSFDRLEAIYDVFHNTYADALPLAPPDLDLTKDFPPAQQQTPFGTLYLAVVQEVDPSRTGSTVDNLNRVAHVLGLPPFVSQ